MTVNKATHAAALGKCLDIAVATLTTMSKYTPLEPSQVSISPNFSSSVPGQRGTFCQQVSR